MTYTWTFTDPAGIKHAFPDTTNVIIKAGTCKGGSVSSADEWSTDGDYYLEATGASGTVTAEWGYVNPKYIIVGVTYAPPGEESYVQYTNSTFVGNTTSLANSFSNQNSVTVMVSDQIGEATNGLMISGSTTTSYTQQSNTSSSVSVSKTTTLSDKTPGPSNSYIGIDHDYDYVWLWLNPLVDFTVTAGASNSVQWTGYSYDGNDPCGCMDVYPIAIGYLNGDFGTIPQNIAEVLARSWAGAHGEVFPSGQGPGLTSADFVTIEESDEYWQCAMSSHPTCPTTVDLTRFTLVNGDSDIVYQQPAPGGQPITQQYTDQYTTTSTQGQGAQYTFQQIFSVEEKFTSGFFLTSLTYDLKQSNTLTWMTQWNNQITDMNTETGFLSVTGPACNGDPCNPEYTGATEYDVYQDNLYGTFLLNAVN